MSSIANSPLHPGVKQPSYDRSQLQPRIVHLGFGAFHRAHQGLYTDEVLRQQDGDWGTCVVKLYSGADHIRALRAQDHLYTVLEKSASSSSARVIGGVCDSLHPELDGMAALLEKLAEPQVAIVSLTITEKGYCVKPGGGELDLDNTQIAHDLAQPEAPRSAIGVIVAGLRLRRDRGLAPFSVLSCDNMPSNGKVARHAVIDFARALDPMLADWIETRVTFPCTMVDRIVPAADTETLNEIETLLGVLDPCAVACEPYRQWVIEDDFAAGRPAWETAGAELVRDVLPYEEMKLRMLNGSHSFLAYLGALAGYETISDCMRDPCYKQAVRELMLKEQAVTLNMPEGVDLIAYADSLIERFCNPSLKHRTLQIAMDGSQKLPQRLLDPVRVHLTEGTPFPHLALGIAGWMRYVSGVDEQGRPIEVCDPMAAELGAICVAHEDPVQRVRALLQTETIFRDDLANNETFIDQVTQSYLALATKGAKAAVADLSTHTGGNPR